MPTVEYPQAPLPQRPYGGASPLGRPQSLDDIRSVPLFAGLPDEILAQVAETATVRRTAADEVLYRVGERPTRLFIVRRGQIDFGWGEGDDFTTLEVLRPGQEFVLAAVLLDRPYATSARSVVPSEVLCVSASALRDLMNERAQLGTAMLASMSRQSRALIQEIGHLKRRSAVQRLGCFLLRLASEQERRDHVVLPFEKRILASRIGTTPEHLSRAFAALRKYGVSTGGRRVALADAGALAAFACPDDRDDDGLDAGKPAQPSGGLGAAS